MKTNRISTQIDAQSHMMNIREQIMNRTQIKTPIVSMLIVLALLALAAAPVSADDTLPGQVDDRAELALFQARLAGGPTLQPGDQVSIQRADAPGAPRQLADRGELAAYQADLAGGFGRSPNVPLSLLVQRDTTETFQADLVQGIVPATGKLLGIEPMNGPRSVEQIADRGELAQYEARLADMTTPTQVLVVCIQMAEEHETFEQIGDLGELAAYQAEMAGGAIPRTETFHDVFVMVDHPTYEALLIR